MTFSPRRRALSPHLGKAIAASLALTLCIGGENSVVPTEKTAHTAAQAGRAINAGLAYGDTLVWMSDKRLGQALDDAVTIGVKWIRVDLSWQDIQYDGRDSYRWDRFDRIVRAATKRHLQVLPTISYTPPWARTSGCDDLRCSPKNTKEFTKFASEAAHRYAPMGVHAWEIWNEPNILFWRPAPNPAAYTKLLKASSTAIREIDPSAVIIMGGLASNKTRGTSKIAEYEFLDSVLKLGAADYVDAVAFHPYTYPYLPSDETDFRTGWEKIHSGKESLQKVLERNGAQRLHIWITETGAPTGGPGKAANGGVDLAQHGITHVTEKRQATIAVDTMTTAAADPLIDAVFWYSHRDLSTNKEERTNFFGLRRADGTAKPAFGALRSAIQSIQAPSQKPEPAKSD
ncbi:hypothetical protein Areg01_63920 [Actinoplanes regularis]|nr:hypothetical protein Areg01_63920 [Actinoplanes regularis]